MESNKDEALKCLSIAQKHRNAGNYPSARRFCQKSVTLFSTAEAVKLREIIETECFGLIEFMEAKHDFSAVGGMEPIKAELRKVAAAIRAAKDRTATGDSTPETTDEQASDTTSDHNGAESH